MQVLPVLRDKPREPSPSVSAYRSLGPLFLISRFFGTFPFDEHCRLSKAWLGYVVTMGVFLPVTIILFFIFVEWSTYPMTGSILSIALTYVFELSIPVAASLQVLRGVYSYRRVVKILSGVDKIDTLLSALGVSEQNKNWFTLKVKFLIYIFLVILMGLVDSTVFKTPLLTTVVESLLYSTSTMQTVLVETHFISLQHLLQTRLGLLRTNLRPIVNPLHQASFKLDVVLKVHSMVYKLSMILNRIFAYQLVISIFMCFVGIISNGHSMAIVLKSTSIERKMEMASHILGVCFRMYTLFYLVTSSRSFLVESKSFNDELYDVMLENSHTKDVANHEKIKLHLTMRREITFSAMDYFNLDNSLILSIVAATATYLVIFLQFDSASTTVICPPGTVHSNASNAPSSSALITIQPSTQ